jgi:hypothetical protein
MKDLTLSPFNLNATLSGKKFFAKMLNEVKTANCFFVRLKVLYVPTTPDTEFGN